MKNKKIVLFEHNDGVRFVLEQSLLCYNDKIKIHSSTWKSEIKNYLQRDTPDLLITELSKVDTTGLEISKVARKINPNIDIIWITVLGCHIFKEEMNRFGNVRCLEKPLDIKEFRNTILKTLEMPV